MRISNTRFIIDLSTIVYLFLRNVRLSIKDWQQNELPHFTTHMQSESSALFAGAASGCVL
jgi:hypothetical protein